jgi:hypothetical protein
MLTELIGDKARLLISSEWDFVPFTYPMSLDLLPNFVLVGGPAPEAGNVLITPLAGHELGHSLWRRSDVAQDLEDKLSERITEALKKLPRRKAELFSEFKLGELGYELITEDSIQFALQQLEETFCDLVGLRIFEHAYIYAFEYFLAPGGDEISLEYPSNSRRMRTLQSIATQWNIQITVGSPYADWIDPTSSSERDTVLSDVLDSLCGDLLPDLEQEVRRMVDGDKPIRIRDAVVEKMVEAFGYSEPYRAEATLPEIITAGWLTVLQRHGMADDLKGFAALNDVMLKTIEVTEYLRKVPSA